MTKDLTIGNPFRVIVGYMIPVFFSLLLTTLYSAVDSIIISQALGADALGGIASTGTLQNLLLGFCYGLCGGFRIPITNAFGAADYRQLRRYVINGAYLAAVSAVLLLAFGAPYTQTMLTIMKTPAENFPHALRYLQILFWGAPFSLLNNYCAGIIRSLGDSKMPLLFLVISAVVNIGLDLVFLLMLNMGAAGAALATVLSQGAAGIACLVYMLKKIPVLRFEKDDLRPSRSDMSHLLRCGVPLALQNTLVFFGGAFLQTTINSLGSIYVNAIAVAGKVTNILICPISVLGNSCSVYFGQNVGAHKPQRIRQGYRICIGISGGCCLLAVVLSLFFTPQLISLFLLDPGQDLIVLAKEYLLIFSLSSVCLGLYYTFLNAVQAMGHLGMSTFICVAQLVARIVGIMTLIPMLGYTGACLCDVSAWVIASVILVPLGYRYLGKLEKQLAE